MTYNLAEFKAWLEENPSKKENLPSWKSVLNKGTGNYFECFLEMKDYNLTWQFSQLQKGEYKGFLKYHQVALKWKAEVDERERERESRRMTLTC